jgi:putative tricarboxylic transport membrane protein
MEPYLALFLMAGVYYGAIFGGSTSSILLNAPGAASTVASSFDGYPMAKNGEPGKALAIAAIASFVGGTVAVILTTLLAPLLAGFATSFGPPEYFALMFLGLTAIAALSEGSMVRALISATLGFMIATIGIDSQTGTSRYVLGSSNLLSGIDFLVVAMGLFAIGEVCYLIINRKNKLSDEMTKAFKLKLTKNDIKEMSGPMSRNSFLGFFIGILPGAGATIASFLAYLSEKKLSKNPESFGKGSIKGLTAPETANNAASTGSFIPLLSLGIPGSGTTALLLGALLVLGVQPGPGLIENDPQLFWGVIISMYIGNIFLLIINLPLVPYIARVLAIPRPLLISLVITFCLIGIYAVSFNTFDLYLLLLFGVLGFVMKKLAFPLAPFILAFILGEMMETALRQSLTLANGNWMVFVAKPVSVIMLTIAALLLISPLVMFIVKKFRNSQM